jgi:aminotransferase in exopolysaccharide biosynthesis
VVNNTIFLSEPDIIGNESKYLLQCLKKNWISTFGKFVDEFEKDIASYTGVKYAISCINGSSALHLALKILGIKPNEEVIVPTLTFIAPVNAIIYNNSYPIFMDADKYFNIDINKCIDFIKEHTFYKSGSSFNKLTGRKIFSIIPVHVWGNAAMLDELIPLCDERNIKVIEDASESLGTKYTKGKFAKKHTGTIGNLGCLSFNGNKIITSGSGGMILTNDANLAKKAKYYSTQAKDDPIYYKHNNTGYNYRMSNIHAAIGLAQLQRIKKILKIKLEIYKLYKSKINLIDGISLHDVPNYAFNNHWLNILKIDKKYGKSRDQLIKLFSNYEVQVRPVWHLNHKQKMFKKFQTFHIENAIELIKQSLCLPSSSNLTNTQISRIVKILDA